MGPLKGDDRRGRAELPDLPPAATRRAKVVPAAERHRAEGEGVHRGVRRDPWKAGTTDDAWDAACAAVDARVQQLATDFLTQALATVGQTPAPGRTG